TSPGVTWTLSLSRSSASLISRARAFGPRSGLARIASRMTRVFGVSSFPIVVRLVGERDGFSLPRRGLKRLRLTPREVLRRMPDVPDVRVAWLRHPDQGLFSGRVSAQPTWPANRAEAGQLVARLSEPGLKHLARHRDATRLREPSYVTASHRFEPRSRG